MKRIFLLLALFVFINASSQVNDSMEIESMRIRSESQFDSNVIGKVLPDFTAKDMNGKTYTNNTVSNGKVTFVNLWFISCEPCIAEIPNLNRLYDVLKDSLDFQFFAITWEPEIRAKEAIKKYNIRFPVLSLASPREAMQLTFGKGFPTNIILDKQGKIRSIISGGSLSPGTGFESYWKQEMEKVLKGNTLIERSKTVQISGNKSGIFFIDSLLKIQSLNDLTNYFKGQSLFIDLWASWCLPCRQEFSYRNNSVDSFLHKHKIVPLFISIDFPIAKGAWESLIYKYQLTGYHLLAEQKLYNDLKRKVYKNEAMEIPRYIIVKNGKIVELNAFRPSDSQKLLKQLIEKLL